MPLADADFRRLLDARVDNPGRIAEALRGRRRRPRLSGDGRIFLVAADHTARGVLGVGGDAMAMASRRGLLDRLATALEHPDVDGVLASADIIEDLALLGLIDDRVVVGTMNRGGLAGATWELDDRMTAYDAAHLADLGLDGGKMLLRIDDQDAGTGTTLERCATAVTELSDRGLMAMIEPLPYTRDERGRAVPDQRLDRRVRAAAVASGLGSSSAHTWLKVGAGEGVEQVLEASSCPAVILGGPLGDDPAATLASWERAVAHAHCRGLVVGRALLYPADGDVAGAVGRAAALVRPRIAGAVRP